MKFPRRRFLGSSATLLGSTLLDALATPLWKWKRSTLLEAATISNPTPASPVTFVDVAKEAGLNSPNVWGGIDHKRYIIEAKGSGLAFFDYDQDGWLDLFCCFWGHNILFHNNGNGTFTDVTKKAGVYDEKVRWGAGCTFLDYDDRKSTRLNSSHGSISYAVFCLKQKSDERLRDRRVELRACVPFDLEQRVLGREPAPVRPVGRHRVEAVGDDQEVRGQRDRRGVDPVVAVPVEALVVVLDRARLVGSEAEAAEQAGG